MQLFTTAREAKEFLVDRIVREAQQEGVPLSEVERKMLYFSESAWTLPDITEVNAAFDCEYNQEEYERKVAQLIGNAREKDRENDRDAFDDWTEAARTLRGEDHYLLVMIDAAGASARPPHDRLKLLGTALVIACVLVAVAFLAAR